MALGCHKDERQQDVWIGGVALTKRSEQSATGFASAGRSAGCLTLQRVVGRNGGMAPREPDTITMSLHANSIQVCR